MKSLYLQYFNIHHQTFIHLNLIIYNNNKIIKFYVNYLHQHLIFLIIQVHIDQSNHESKSIVDTNQIIMGHGYIVITSIMFYRIVPLLLKAIIDFFYI